MQKMSASNKNRSRTSSQQFQPSSSSTPPPWEPYKAATTSTSIIPPNSDSLIACFKRDGLVKYKLDTDLNEFNSTRPGSQFDDSDINMVDKWSSANTETFLDARFYTDASFLKLAAQLKNRLNTSSPVSQGFVNKYVILNKTLKKCSLKSPKRRKKHL